MVGINFIDWLVIGGYFLAVLLIAAWAIRKRNRGEKTSAEYFLAGRNVGWFVVGASLFASNIGSEHLVGLAGAGASSGVVLGQFELQASLVLLLLGWLFVPFYVRSGVVTMPEFLERRYSPAARWYLSVVSIIGYVLTKISVTIYAGGVVFEALLGIDFWTGAMIVVLFTGVYTVLGGLRAVIYTDVMQAVVLIAGSTAVTVIGLVKLGGWGPMVELAPEGFMDMWKPMSDPDFPWTGIAFGAPIIAVWYWCTDQFIVQRTLSARGIDDARRGTIMAGFLKQLPLFIFVIPGVIAYSLNASGQLDLAASDQALPALVAALLPVGVRGLVIAGLLAALMSSLSSVFNSCSTLITWDLYRKIRPEASEKKLVLVGQLSTIVLVVLGILWIPVMSNISGTLYQYLQSVQAYISPPIAAVFVLGIFWKRLNGKGAIASLGTGFVLGVARLLAELNKDSLTGFMYDFATINFMHVAIFLFLICAVVLIVVSLMTEPPSEEQIRGLTMGTTDAGETLPTDPSKRRLDLILSVVLVGMVAAVMLWFS